METIIQLRESEYNDLVSKANYNQYEINSKAEALYNKHGTHKIVLSVTADEYDDEIQIQARAYVRDWDSKFPLKESDKKKIIYFVQDKAEQMFRRSFGDIIYSLESVKRKEKKLDILIKKNLVLTVTGWLVALGIIFIIIIK